MRWLTSDMNGQESQAVYGRLQVHTERLGGTSHGAGTRWQVASVPKRNGGRLTRRLSSFYLRVHRLRLQQSSGTQRRQSLICTMWWRFTDQTSPPKQLPDKLDLRFYTCYTENIIYTKISIKLKSSKSNFLIQNVQSICISLQLNKWVISLKV